MLSLSVCVLVCRVFGFYLYLWFFYGGLFVYMECSEISTQEELKYPWENFGIVNNYFESISLLVRLLQRGCTLT